MESKLTSLKYYDSMLNIMLDKEILHTNGIESTIQNEDAVEVLPMLGDTNDGLRLVVFEKDLALALKVLNDYHSSVNGE